MLGKLRERFHPSAVKTRRQGGKDLQYIDIASTINRLNDVADLNWTWDISKSDLTLSEGKWLGFVQGYLTVSGVARSGVGAGVGTDPDMAIKTADAEALKKAGHKFGIGLELWDEDVRTANERVMRAMGSDDVTSLKTGVFELALMGGAEPTAEGVAAYFGVTEEMLKDTDTLREILHRQPVAA